MNQVITISTDGSIVGLDHKRKGLDLRQFGKAKTERATLIEWDEAKQAWFILWVADGQAVGLPWSDAEEFQRYGVDFTAHNGYPLSDEAEENPTIFFNDYEDAVTAEVAVIQAMQLRGDSIN